MKCTMIIIILLVILTGCSSNSEANNTNSYMVSGVLDIKAIERGDSYPIGDMWVSDPDKYYVFISGIKIAIDKQLYDMLPSSSHKVKIKIQNNVVKSITIFDGQRTTIIE